MMKMRNWLAGAMASVGALTGDPAAITEQASGKAWETIDPESFVSFTTGIPRDKLDKNLEFKWLHKFKSPTRPTLLLASTGHGGTLGHTNEEGSLELRKELRAFVDIALELWQRRKISCIYMEPLSIREADKLNDGALEDMRRVRKGIGDLSREIRKSIIGRNNLGRNMLSIREAMGFYNKLPNIIPHVFGRDYEYHALLTQEAIDSIRIVLDAIRFDPLHDVPYKKAEEVRGVASGVRKSIDDIVSVKGPPNTLVIGVPYHLAFVHNVPVRFCGTATPEIEQKIEELKAQIVEEHKKPTGLEEAIQNAKEDVRMAEKRDLETLKDRTLAESIDSMFEVYERKKQLATLQAQAKDIKDKRADAILDANSDFVDRVRESAALETMSRDSANSPEDVKLLFYGDHHRKNWSGRNIEVLGERGFNILAVTHKHIAKRIK